MNISTIYLVTIEIGEANEISIITFSLLFDQLPPYFDPTFAYGHVKCSNISNIKDIRNDSAILTKLILLRVVPLLSKLNDESSILYIFLGVVYRRVLCRDIFQPTV